MLPGLLSYGDHVTIRQLLNHTGGVPDYAATVSGTLDRFGQGRFRAWTPQELVALVVDQPPSFPPVPPPGPDLCSAGAAERPTVVTPAPGRDADRRPGPSRWDPAFSTIVLSTPDGRQQLGIMANVGERAPNPVSEAFLQGYRALGMRLLTLQGFDEDGGLDVAVADALRVRKVIE
jgi:hypothetical protein